MGWAGDLLYPGNPGRRKEVNQLQQDVETANTTLLNDVNSYNNQFQTVQSIAALNAVLTAMKYHTKLAREDVPVPQDARVKSYTDSVATQVLDQVATLGGGMAVISLLKSGWAVAKIKLSALKEGSSEAAAGDEIVEEELTSVAEMGSEISTTAGLEVASGTAGADVVGTATAEELSSMTELAETLAGTESSTMVADAAATSAEIAEDGAIVGGEVAASAATGALLAGATLVVLIGVDLILGAINGAAERSKLQEAVTKLEAAKVEIAKTQATVDKANALLAKISASSTSRYKIIIADYTELEQKLAALKQLPPVLLPLPDYSDLKTILISQNYLINNFQTPISMLGEFKNLITPGPDGSAPDYTVANFQNPDLLPSFVLKILAEANKTTIPELKAYMKWFYELRTITATKVVPAAAATSSNSAMLFKASSRKPADGDMDGEPVRKKLMTQK